MRPTSKASLDEMHISNRAKSVANALRLTRIDDIKSRAIYIVNTCISGHAKRAC
jgi:Tfp pilus assembly protein FimT